MPIKTAQAFSIPDISLRVHRVRFSRLWITVQAIVNRRFGKDQLVRISRDDRGAYYAGAGTYSCETHSGRTFTVVAF